MSEYKLQFGVKMYILQFVSACKYKLQFGVRMQIQATVWCQNVSYSLVSECKLQFGVKMYILQFVSDCKYKLQFGVRMQIQATVWCRNANTSYSLVETVPSQRQMNRNCHVQLDVQKTYSNEIHSGPPTFLMVRNSECFPVGIGACVAFLSYSRKASRQ